MVGYMNDLARSKISMISKISLVQKNIGSPKHGNFDENIRILWIF